MQKEIKVKTKKRLELVDISAEVNEAVKNSKAENGACIIFTPHATAAIIINENYDQNICDDFLIALKNLIPQGKWRHDEVDGNADAHIKAAICGPSEAIPIKEGKLQLGRWQSPMLAEFDGPRERTIIISMIEDKR